MSLLSELTEIANQLKVPARTAVYSGKPPDEYLVFTPLYDCFEIHADNKPGIDVQEVRISLFSKGNYNQTKSRLVKALLNSDITITARKYVGHEDDTSYNHYLNLDPYGLVHHFFNLLCCFFVYCGVLRLCISLSVCTY